LAGPDKTKRDANEEAHFTKKKSNEEAHPILNKDKRML
jgi:hypothetical protein